MVLGHEISKYLGYLVLILSFLEGLIEAYKASLATIMPFLFTNYNDNTHYSRWGTVHLNDMLFLQSLIQMSIGNFKMETLYCMNLEDNFQV